MTTAFHASRARLVATVAAVSVGVVLVAGWMLRGSQSLETSFDPDRTYRLQRFTADNWDRLLHADMGQPGYVRLYDNIDGHLVGTSGIVDFFTGDNGQVLWLMGYSGQVSAGLGVTFYHVHPQTRDGRKLPIAAEVSGPPRILSSGATSKTQLH